MKRLAALIVVVVALFPTTASASTWQPFDECARVQNPGPVYLSQRTMSWCPTVAHYLDAGEQLGAWTWKRGDLTRLMLIVQCESGGNPSAVNGAGQNAVYGLFQHKLLYWWDRGSRVARLFGFSNPNIHMPFDNIAAGVWLFKTSQRPD